MFRAKLPANISHTFDDIQHLELRNGTILVPFANTASVSSGESCQLRISHARKLRFACLGDRRLHRGRLPLHPTDHAFGVVRRTESTTVSKDSGQGNGTNRCGEHEAHGDPYRD